MAKSQSIGAFLREFRLRSGMEIDQICEALKIESVERLYSYEAGKTPIPLQSIYQFAKLYRIPADQVLELFYKITEHQDEVETDSESSVSKQKKTI